MIHSEASCTDLHYFGLIRPADPRWLYQSFFRVAPSSRHHKRRQSRTVRIVWQSTETDLAILHSCLLEHIYAAVVDDCQSAWSTCQYRILYHNGLTALEKLKVSDELLGMSSWSMGPWNWISIFVSELTSWSIIWPHRYNPVTCGVCWLACCLGLYAFFPYKTQMAFIWMSKELSWRSGIKASKQRIIFISFHGVDWEQYSCNMWSVLLTSAMLRVVNVLERFLRFWLPVKAMKVSV